jgi:amidohydrolase
MTKKVYEIIEKIEEELKELNEYIFRNPELGLKEYKASKAHVDLLKKYKFQVEEEYIGIKTAFMAVKESEKPGPTIAFLAEYDALPGIGHGCGHNLLGTTSTGAGIVLGELLSEIGGKVIVFGTPAEENFGAKVDMANNGSFDDVDVVMLSHPMDKYLKSGKSLAMEAIQFTFKGRSAHAASFPEKGINALDGVINTFNNINALRQHIKSDARVHGIIKEGGMAANIVPDLAVAQFYVRATTKKYLQELVEKVKNAARGASLAAGTELEITNYEASYDNMVTNITLMDAYSKNLEKFGIKDKEEGKTVTGSMDAGNVSHVCPIIHPSFSISDKELVPHTIEFAKATIEPLAYDGMKKTIGTLVLTAVDIIQDEKLLSAIKYEFENREK